MKFVVVDVETANADLASICQVGVVWFEGGSVARKWKTLVDPEDDFSGLNVDIHGISEEMVRGAPTIAQIESDIRSFLSGNIVASHMPFDRVAISRAMGKYGLDNVECSWLDTARVVRRTWLDCSRRGYGLREIAKKLGIEYRHHDAEEDARAAGEVLLRAIAETGLSVQDWLVRAGQPIGGLARDGDPDGPLAGETIVFTGELAMPRREAAELAARAGCDVSEGVNRDTTILVVGDQDSRKLRGEDKSSKHRKAEDLIRKGQAIRILCESDFHRLIATDSGQ